MAAISSDQIVSILREEITNYDFNQNDEEVGKVVRVGDGIATIYGMNHAMYGEIVVFDSGVKGMVQDIKENQIGCILFGQDSEIHEGSTAVRTHKRAGVPVGEGFIGRIVNALGEPIDGKGEIQSDDYRPVEEPAPSITPSVKRRLPWQSWCIRWISTVPWIIPSWCAPLLPTRPLYNIFLPIPPPQWQNTLCTRARTA